MLSKKKPVELSFYQKMRAYLFTGILVTTPTFITVYLAWVFIGFVDNRVTPLIPKVYNPESYLPFAIPGLGLVVLILFLMLIGAITAGFLGRFWIRFSEQLLNRMPVVRSIYNAIKQILQLIVIISSPPIPSQMWTCWVLICIIPITVTPGNVDLHPSLP